MHFIYSSLLMLLLLCSNTLKAQDNNVLLEVIGYELGGKWTGKLYQEDKQRALATAYDFELQIDPYQKTVSGYSYIRVGDNNAKISFRGKVNGLQVELTEFKIQNEKIRDKYMWCLKRMHLRFDFDKGRYRLKGAWDGKTEGNDCSPGSIEVYKNAIKA